jgi:FdhD protein
MAKVTKRPDAPIRYARYRPGRWEEVDAFTIVETPVTLAVNSEAWLTFLCTPTDLDALAVGFLFNEGVIQARKEVVSVDICASGDQVDVWFTHTAEKPPTWRRTSGCSGGLTAVELPAAELPSSDQPAVSQPAGVLQEGGLQSSSLPAKSTPNGENGERGNVLHPAHFPEGEQFSPDRILGLMGLFLQTQHLYRKARGVHSSALSDGEQILIQADDIGRHNTLDKIAGRYLLDGLAADRKILLTTGRVSSEMLQKAHRLGAEILVSRTAPNNLSIRLAEETGITLIGYARRDEFQLYTHPERLSGAPVPGKLEVSAQDRG